MWRFTYLILCLTLIANVTMSYQQTGERKINRDPEAVQIITSDIDNFWKAYDAAKPDYCFGVFQRDYFDKGSEGLKAFKRSRINQCSFIETLATHPGYYAAMRESTLRVSSMKEPMRESFRKLKLLYDDAVFPDVYFLIGCMNSGGTTADAGLLIGTEMYGRTTKTPNDEMDDWLRAVTKPVDLIPHIVAHELVHYQKKYPAGQLTLLGAAIKEGSADFVAELISGHHINPNLHEYSNPREQAIWTEFKSQMNGNDLSNWLHQGDQAKGRPADLGYYVGYKICEAHYRAAKDKKQAVKDILEIRDFNQFLKDSDYERKFAN